MTRARWSATLVADEDGSIATFGLSWLAAAVLALLLIVDLTAYQVAGARAQTAADAAALAAVAAVDPRGGVTLDPSHQARRVAEANGGQVLDCTCHRGAREVTVSVDVPVRAVVVTRFAGRSVEATARAKLVPTVPDGDASTSSETPDDGPSPGS